LTTGKELKKIRTNQGLSIRDVVMASDRILDKTTLSRIERDERGLSLKAAYCLSKIYNINIESLAEISAGKKIKHERIPFDATLEERVFLNKYRILSSRHRKMLDEMAKAFVFFGEYRTSGEARRLMLEELRKIKN